MSEKKKLIEKIKEKENREKRKKQEELQQVFSIVFPIFLRHGCFLGSHQYHFVITDGNSQDCMSTGTAQIYFSVQTSILN